MQSNPATAGHKDQNQVSMPFIKRHVTRRLKASPSTTSVPASTLANTRPTHSLPKKNPTRSS